MFIHLPLLLFQIFKHFCRNLHKTFLLFGRDSPQKNLLRFINLVSQQILDLSGFFCKFNLLKTRV